MEYKRIFRDGGNLLFGYVGSAIIGLVNLMLLTRILSTEEMGIYSLFLMVVNVGLVIGLNWSDSSIVRHGREEFVTRKRINQSFWARSYIYGAAVLVLGLLLVIFRKPIMAYVGLEAKYAILVFTLIVFMSLLNYISHMLRSVDLIKRSSYILFMQKAVYLIGLVVIFFNIAKGQLHLALILLNISFLAILIVNVLRFDFSLIKPYKFNKQYFKKIWRYSWPQFIGFSGLSLIHYIDLFVIKQFMGLSDVGVYSVAYAGFSMIQGIVLLVNQVFMPLLTEYKTKKRFDLVRLYINKIPMFVAGWSVLVVIGVLLSKFFIPLVFTEKYILAIAPFNILLVATICTFVTACLISIMNSFDLIMHLQVTNIVVAVLNVILDFVMIPKMGIIGAAYATLIALFVGMSLRIIIIYANRKKIMGEVKVLA